MNNDFSKKHVLEDQETEIHIEEKNEGSSTFIGLLSGAEFRTFESTSFDQILRASDSTN